MTLWPCMAILQLALLLLAHAGRVARRLKGLIVAEGESVIKC